MNTNTYRPYWGLVVEGNVSRLKNETYNMPDGLGKGFEFGYGGGIGAGIRGDLGRLYLAIEGFINIDSIYHEKATNPHIDGMGEDTEEVEIYSIFNGRINVGYNFNRKFTMFGSLHLKHWNIFPPGTIRTTMIPDIIIT